MYKVCVLADPDTGLPNMPTKYYKATLDLMRKYMDDYTNMDYMRATRYLSDSIGGQLADISFVQRDIFKYGKELGTGAGIERAKEKALDMIQFLLAQKA